MGRTTYLLGAVLASRSNKLKLDTANFIFDNYSDKDVSGSVGVNVNIGLDPKGVNPASWDGTGSLAYRDQRAITYATLGLGDITIRNRPNQDLSGLNRDLGNVQRVTRDIDFDVHIPALNLAKLKEDLEASRLFLIAGTTQVPDNVKAMGKNAEKLFRRNLMRGMSMEEAIEASNGANFHRLVTQYNYFDQLRALSPDGTIPEGQLWLAALDEGYSFERSDNGDVMVSMPCGLMAGPSRSECDLSLTQFKAYVKTHPAFLKALMTKQATLAQDRDLQEMVGVLVSCISEFPEYFVQFVDAAQQVSGTDEYGRPKSLLDSLGRYKGSILLKARNSILEGDHLEGVMFVRNYFGSTAADPQELPDHVVEAIVDEIPILNSFVDGARVYEAATEGEYWVAAGNGITLFVGVIPGGKKVVKGAVAGAKLVGNGLLIGGRWIARNAKGLTGDVLGGVFGRFGRKVPDVSVTRIDHYVDLTNGRSQHILKNHRAGAGIKGKTEFPSNWDDDRIIHQVSDIATDPTLVRQIDNRGTPFVEGMRDGVEIRVTFFDINHKDAGKISSAYPINVPVNPR